MGAANPRRESIYEDAVGQCPGGRPSDATPVLLAYLHTQVECATPQVACSYHQSLKTCISCSQDPGSFCLMSKPLGSLRFCYFHGVPMEEKEVCLHTLCIPGAFAALSESHLSQSEKKKSPQVTWFSSQELKCLQNASFSLSIHLFILLHVKCSSPSRVCFN